MRSSAVIAMLVAGALAVPAPHLAARLRRDDADVVVTTTTAVEWTTVYPGQLKTVHTTVSAATSSSSAAAAVQPSSASAVPTSKPVAAADVKQVLPTSSSSVAVSSSASSASSAASSGSSGSLSSFMPSTGGLTSFQQAAVAAHNQHRANHSAPALTYDTGLEAAAQILANRCFWSGDGKDVHDVTIDESSVGPYGQNAAAGVSDISTVISSMWYSNEMPLYTYYGQEPPASAFTATGHFTQVVWHASQRVGCAISSCPNGVTGWSSANSVAICNYAGPGNYQGEYAENVLAPKGMAADKDTVQDQVDT